MASSNTTSIMAFEDKNIGGATQSTPSGTNKDTAKPDKPGTAKKLTKRNLTARPKQKKRQTQSPDPKQTPDPNRRQKKPRSFLLETQA